MLLCSLRICWGYSWPWRNVAFGMSYSSCRMRTCYSIAEVSDVKANQERIFLRCISCCSRQKMSVTNLGELRLFENTFQCLEMIGASIMCQCYFLVVFTLNLNLYDCTFIWIRDSCLSDSDKDQLCVTAYGRVTELSVLSHHFYLSVCMLIISLFSDPHSATAFQVPSLGDLGK